MAPALARDRSGITVAVLSVAAVVLLAVAALAGGPSSDEAAPAAVVSSDSTPQSGSPRVAPGSTPDPSPGPSSSPSSGPSSSAEPTPAPGPPAVLPNGGRRVFADGAFLVAYYGTASTPVLGVLGEDAPDRMDQRLRRAARPYRRAGRPVQRVYELIVTVADRSPGKDGDYSHDIARADVQRYIDAAHANGALLLLDIQPGRSGFLEVAKRWEWALRDPWVGLALDPEWRMGKRQVPGRTLGSVDAREVNRASAWLSQLRRSLDLPEKIFMLHQFRSSMIRRPEALEPRGGLAMVQHVDGFGTRSQKLDTYRAVARPAQFTMGFKLFYDEDVNRMGPAQVRAIRPRVRFISFQ